MNIRPLVGAALLAAGVFSAAGGDPASAPDTFEGMLAHTLRHHPGLRAARAGTEAARERVPQAGTPPDPRLGVTRFGESVQTRTGPQETVWSLNQSFPWFGTLDRKTEAASAEARAAAREAEVLELRLTRELAGLFYEYAYNDKAKKLTAENLNLLRDLEPVVRSKVEGGEDLNALLRLKVETGKLDDTLASLGQRRRILQARLRAMLNFEPGDEIGPPVWEAPESDVSDPSDVSDHTPELLVLEARREAARARVELAERAGYPDLMLGVNYIQVGDPEVNPGTPDAGRDPWNVMAAVRIPLLRGSIKAERAEARALERRAELEVEQVRNELRAELEAARADRADAHRRMNLYGEELLGLAEQAVENSRAAYEGGRTGILEVIDSERSLLDLRLMYWRAAADAHIHRVTIETLTPPSE